MGNRKEIGRTTRERFRFLVDVFQCTADRWSEVEGFRLGAAFSFYATFAIFPMLLLSVTIIGFLIGDDQPARERVIAAVSDPTSPVRHLLDQTLSAMQASRSARGISAVVGLLSLVFSASGAMVELNWSLNRIWREPIPKTKGVTAAIRAFLHERLTGVALIGGIGLTMLTSLVVSSVVSGVVAATPAGSWPAFARTLDEAMSLALMVGTIAATFHFVPRTRPRWADVIGGATLTAVFLALLKSVFATYLARLTSYSAYGIVGGFLALATWIYLSSQIILLGATLTRVICEKMGGCNIVERAVPHSERAQPERGPRPQPLTRARR